jgi:hypothetical protein
MTACLSPCEDNLQSVEAPRGVPSAVPHVQSSEVPRVVPSEALHIQSCAPSQWHTTALLAVLPRVSFPTPTLPRVSLEVPPSEVPMGVPSEALPVHSCSAPPEVIHSQSYAPAEGPSELPRSSVPPEALPVRSWAPSKGPSETPSSAPSEVPLHPDVSPRTPPADAVASQLRPKVPAASP